MPENLCTMLYILVHVLKLHNPETVWILFLYSPPPLLFQYLDAVISDEKEPYEIGQLL